MERERLEQMLASVRVLIEQAEGNPWGEYLRRHLVPVEVELERQLKSAPPEGVRSLK
jgi:hypothetical protein